MKTPISRKFRPTHIMIVVQFQRVFCQKSRRFGTYSTKTKLWGYDIFKQSKLTYICSLIDILSLKTKEIFVWWSGMKVLQSAQGPYFNSRLLTKYMQIIPVLYDQMLNSLTMLIDPHSEVILQIQGIDVHPKNFLKGS